MVLQNIYSSDQINYATMLVQIKTRLVITGDIEGYISCSNIYFLRFFRLVK